VTAKPPARRRAAARRPQLTVVERGTPRTDRKWLQRVVATTLAYVERPALPVSLLLTDDAEIAAIHGAHLDDPTPTDVISFDLGDEAELVVSKATARRVAKQHGHTARAELALYIVHGLLHCCGYDDLRARDRVRMRAAERDVLARLRLRVHAVDSE
jgi:probable rRNA maturation factor